MMGATGKHQANMTTARKFGRRAKAQRRVPLIAVAAVALVIGLSLSACGKRGNPEPPPGAKGSEYPRQYPDPRSY